MAKRKEGEKAVQNADDTDQEKQENNEEEEPNFSDPEGYSDDISDEELLGSLLKQKPKETDGVESIIVVDGAPIVGQDRLEKLRNVIQKIFSKFGKIINEHYPLTEEGETKGYIFLEYSSPVNALEAVQTANGHKLDRQHKFSVNLFTDFDKYDVIPTEWEPPEPQPYKDQGNLHYFLQDVDACDQYIVIHEGGDKVSIWQNTVSAPTLLEDRERWTETYVRWSPLGTYLATFHSRGIALWGGETFRQIMKFSHTGVQFIDFSPCEKYLVTFSPLVDNRSDEPQAVVIWDTRTGVKKRAFNPERPPVWPMLKWASDDKYFARLGTDILSVYETPSFGMLEKKSIKVSGIRDFSWSPTDSIIGFWVAESDNVPARMTLLEIPSRQEIRSKNLFNVADCKMHWQKSGDYLCVKVDRYGKLKKEKSEVKYSGMYCNFEIFHMREKQIPVDSLEVKETIQAFAWEPVGQKFAIMHGEVPNINVSFYEVKSGQTPTLVKTYERKECNHLFWAPSGQFIVLAGMGQMNGTLEFIDTKDFTLMKVAEHFMVTDVEWDPTGRYVVTVVSYWAQKQGDTGFCVWSFQGKLLQKNNVEKLCQLLWRPRPPTLLTQKQIKEIKKNLKKYSAQFEVKDQMMMSKASKELIENRRKLMNTFQQYRKGKEEEYNSQKQRRRELRNDMDTDSLESPKNLDEEVVEFFIKEEVIIIE